MKWSINIEESQKLFDKNVIVLVNIEGQKLYMRPKKIEGNNLILLEPLTKAEMLSLGIEVQESYNQNYFDVDVEESKSELEKEFDAEKKKSEVVDEVIKKHGFNINSIEDMQRAKALAEKIIEGLQSTEKEPEKKTADKELADKVRTSIIEGFADRGLDSPRLETAEDLDTAVEILKQLPKQAQKTTFSGFAPLNDAQRGISNELLTKQYETPQALIEDLRKKIEEGDPQAKAIHEEFLKRALRNPRLWCGTSEGVGLEAIKKKPKKKGD